MAEFVAPFTMRTFARALVMPNLSPPITTPDQLDFYRRDLERIASKHYHSFEPLMTFYANESVHPETVPALKAAGAIAGKYYPKGVTTGSEAGATDIEALFPLFKAMEAADLVLCLHGETPGVYTLDREAAFLDACLGKLVRNFPELRIVVEHITTSIAVELVRFYDNVAATITAHHLYLTLDDVIGDKLNPHAFCKPVAKRPNDREALIEAAISGDPKFFFGSDTAPHLKHTKECASGCAGVFSAPCALEAVTELFAVRGALDRLEGFMSVFGAKFYELPLNEGTVTLSADVWRIEKEIFYYTSEGNQLFSSGIVPFRAGDLLHWRILPPLL